MISNLNLDESPSVALADGAALSFVRTSHCFVRSAHFLCAPHVPCVTQGGSTRVHTPCGCRFMPAVLISTAPAWLGAQSLAEGRVRGFESKHLHTRRLPARRPFTMPRVYAQEQPSIAGGNTLRTRRTHALPKIHAVRSNPKVPSRCSPLFTSRTWAPVGEREVARGIR